MLCSLCLIPVWAGKWTTHFAYNNVVQIAMSSDKVYAISDGSLFSVNKSTEQIEVYNRQSGLHATGINCIHYDQQGNQLIICYSTGQVDILSAGGVQYVSGLYDKDMTQRKTIYNVTIHGRTAYLSTHYGVQTMDLRENKMVDSYWLRPNGLETPIQDVLIQGDSIYAFAEDSLYCASMRSNLSDYTYWKRELRSGRISPDADKGVHYQDGTSEWYCGYAEGIVRFTATDRLTYKPNGPLVNNPYRLRAVGNKLGMVQGSYAVPAAGRPGMVMTYEDGSWRNYDEAYIASHVELPYVTDNCDIAFDPLDPTHFYVASFGYGLYEFRQDTFYAHHNTTNSAIEPVFAGGSYPYVWVDGLKYDAAGNLWMLNVCYNGVKVLKPDSTWSSLSNVACQDLDRAKDLLISVHNPNIKFISTIRNGIGVFDDNGTIDDQSDDRAATYKEFVDAMGNTYTPSRVSSFLQAPSGTLLIGTETGLYRIDSPEEMLNGNRLCVPLVVNIPEEGRTHIFEAENIRSMTTDDQGHVWIGTQLAGAYCLSADLTQVLEHVSSDNSPMPSNDVIALCWMDTKKHLFIGTSEGLVEYDPNSSGEGLNSGDNTDPEGLEMGSILQWKLHLSYNNPTEIVSTPRHIYAVANGSLFSVDRADASTFCWSKATGLTGSTVAHIAYDGASEQLAIGYTDGRIDLLSENGTVQQMPDLFIKTGLSDVSINQIYAGTRHVYLAMPFGIIAINPRRAEVSDTYYIGADATSIDVQQLVEMGDSLYAFSFDNLYVAALKDNLVDYSFWHSRSIPFDKVQQAVAFNGHLYALKSDSTLYRRDGDSWTKVVANKFTWIHVSGGQFLTYTPGTGLIRMTAEEQFVGLSNNYTAQDAVYTSGEYWLAEARQGLVRLGSGGDDFFRPEGPMNNYGYNLQIAHGQVYVSPGGRWAESYGRMSDLSIYDGQQWRGIPYSDTWYYTGHPIYDVVGYAVDANDPGHFYAATYGTGVFEFKDYKAVAHYDSANSTLRRYAPTVSNEFFTCTDGAMTDEQGNTWILNATSIGQPLHIKAPNGQWHAIRLRSNGEDIRFNTPGAIWTDRRDSRYKWLINQRVNPGVIFLYDGGTPTSAYDDRCLKRNQFVDQNGNTISPTNIFCLTQDHKDRIWIGTDKGILLIPSDVDFFTSNACRRIIIPRNDGTNLGDYLLGDEQIKCMAVDAGDRMWIGTANSGLFLIEDDTITVAHFTEHNSLLPSNSILSIAIMPTTGEVWVGTSNGIASYLSDASTPQENMKSAYAFPNPVRPDYGGYVSITNLMDNSEVRIVDSGGNLVCRTRSHGGTAVWDCRGADGRRATPGVYTALCNAKGGHAAVKILLIR